MQVDICAQRNFKSVCVIAQSGQSLSFPPEEKLDPWLSIESLSKTLIRLRGNLGLSESSIGVRTKLYPLLDTAVLLYANTGAYQHACFCMLLQSDQSHYYFI